MELTPKEIGKRISLLRKTKGYTQDFLAEKLNMSRSSLAQLELGNRSVDILELQKLSRYLVFSIDSMVSEDFVQYQTAAAAKGDNPTEQQIRNPYPVLDKVRFEQVLLYMIGWPCQY